ncbi:hypothetical protein WN943_001067 [Citrus x changshan-huyou]
MGLGSKIFLLLGLVMTIVVLLTSTKVAAARNMAEASTATRKVEFSRCIEVDFFFHFGQDTITASKTKTL